MKTHIQTEGGEVVIYGNANFMTTIAKAVEIYEQSRRTLRDEKATELSKNISEGKMKAQATRKKPRRFRAPRWTPEEEQKVKAMLDDRGNYSKMGVKGSALTKLARELRRSSGSLRVHINSKRDLRLLRSMRVSELKRG